MTTEDNNSKKSNPFFTSIVFPGSINTSPFSYKKLAAECYKQRSSSSNLAYLLPIIFLHMHLEDLLFQNFVTIHFASRAGISTSYNYSRQELKNFIKRSRQGELADKITLLSKSLVLEDCHGVDTTLIDEEEIGYVKRLSTVRNYLIHCCNLEIPLLRISKSAYPIQEENLSEDILDAFRIVLTLELRLIDTLRHIESTLFECVCQAHLNVTRPRSREWLSFTANIFKNNNSFHTVVSRIEFPIPKLSRIAERWDSFFNFDDLYWPLGEIENSIEQSLNSFSNYVRKKWKKDGEVSPLEKHDIQWSPPKFGENDWPWNRFTLTHKNTTEQLKKLLAY